VRGAQPLGTNRSPAADRRRARAAGPRVRRPHSRASRRRAISRAAAIAGVLAPRLVARKRLVSMAVAKRLKSVLVGLLAVFCILLWFAALLFFTKVTENSDDFAQRKDWRSEEHTSELQSREKLVCRLLL